MLKKSLITGQIPEQELGLQSQKSHSSELLSAMVEDLQKAVVKQ